MLHHPAGCRSRGFLGPDQEGGEVGPCGQHRPRHGAGEGGDRRLRGPGPEGEGWRHVHRDLSDSALNRLRRARGPCDLTALIPAEGGTIGLTVVGSPSWVWSWKSGSPSELRGRAPGPEGDPGLVPGPVPQAGLAAVRPGELGVAVRRRAVSELAAGSEVLLVAPSAPWTPSCREVGMCHRSVGLSRLDCGEAREAVGLEVGVKAEDLAQAQALHEGEGEGIRHVDGLVVVAEEQLSGTSVILLRVRLHAPDRGGFDLLKTEQGIPLPYPLCHPIQVFDEDGPPQDEPRPLLRRPAEEGAGARSGPPPPGSSSRSWRRRDPPRGTPRPAPRRCAAPPEPRP